MPKHKLSQEELETILGSFDWDGFTIRSIWKQSRLFQTSFFFINIYVGIYVLFGGFFPELIFSSLASELLLEEYDVILSARSLIGLLLLVAFNFAFIFSNFFRFVALISFSYLLNASIDVFSIFFPFFDLSKFNIATLLFWLRPVSLISILICIYTFDPDR